MPRHESPKVKVTPWSACLTAAVLWTLSVFWFGRTHHAMGMMAGGGAAYAAALAILCVWLVPGPQSSDRLVATGNSAPRAVWYVVAAGTLIWAFVYGYAYGGYNGGIAWLTPAIHKLRNWWLVRGVDGTTLLNFVSFACIPAAVLLACGAKPREMGLCAPVPGTRLATAACLALPAAFIIWGFANGKLTAAALLVMVVHNTLSNGFSEEFQCRGLILATLRSIGPTAWAVVIQGLLFALIHVGGGIAEEKGDIVMAVAASVALNFPMGVALGVIAVRTGSLALSTAIHVAGHVMKDLLA